MTHNDATYSDLIALRSALEVKHSELQSQLESAAQDLKSVSRTLALLDESHFKPDPSSELASPTVAPIDTLSVEGLSQIDALVKIAQHGGGRLNLSEARRIIVQAGLTSSKKNISNILFNVVNRSGRFKRIEPGIYELIEENKPQRPLIRAHYFPPMEP